jgi:hypothetical protein
MTMRHPRPRRLIGVAAFVGVMAAVALAVAPAASVRTMDQKHLDATVMASSKGPLAVGDSVWTFIYVSNGNHLTEASDGQFNARDTVHNALVVSGVDETIFVDGDLYTTINWGPPPYPAPPGLPGYAKRWVETVECPSAGPPCNAVRSPAVLPGEKTSVFFTGWGHGAGEPNGTYEFRFTVHGTLNGDPVELTANSKSIKMTD